MIFFNFELDKEIVDTCLSNRFGLVFGLENSSRDLFIHDNKLCSREGDGIFYGRVVFQRLTKTLLFDNVILHYNFNTIRKGSIGIGTNILKLGLSYDDLKVCLNIDILGSTNYNKDLHNFKLGLCFNTDIYSGIKIIYKNFNFCISIRETIELVKYYKGFNYNLCVTDADLSVSAQLPILHFQNIYSNFIEKFLYE